MKNIFTLLILFTLINREVLAQGFVPELQYQPVIRPYVPNTAVDDYRNLLDKANADYDRNKDYHRKLSEWIYNNKRQSQDADEEFKADINTYENELNYLAKRGDYENQSNDLENIYKNFKRAIDSYNLRIKERPKKIWESGNNKLKNKQYEDAIKDYNELIQYSPDFIYVFRNRGFAYNQLNKKNLALNDFNKYIDKVKDDDFAYQQRGWLKDALGDYSGAKADFDMLIELSPDDSYAYYSRGVSKSKMNDNAGAVADYTKSINLKPDFSMAFNNRGWCKFEMKLFNEALRDVNEAIKFDTTNWVAFDSRQEIKFALSDYKGCVSDCIIAISLNKNCANSYYFRGRANFKLNNKKTICSDWETAANLGKNEAFDLLAKYCSTVK